MTGATLVDNEFDLKLEDVKLKHLGEAKVIKADSEFTHIVGGNHTEEALQARLQEIDVTIEAEESKHLKGVHRERRARMTAQIAEI